MRRLLLSAIGISLLSLLLAACGMAGRKEEDRPLADLTQRDGGEGGVTVEATWVTRQHAGTDGIASRLERYPLDRYVAFHLKLDTHSVDLNQYDLTDAATLSVDGGAPQSATAWVALGDDSHHREGLLIFARKEGASRVELTVIGVAGVPQRVLRWAPPPAE